MAPLDSGSELDTWYSPYRDTVKPALSIIDAPSLGEALRAARAASGRSLEDLADLTRVRRQYLLALEDSRFDLLPSRPFATGYVRAYARALGLDEETAAERFKSEHPDNASTLVAPVGSELDDVKPKGTRYFIAAGVLVAGIVVWNVARHAILDREPRTAALATAANDFWTPGATPGAPIRIGAPLPAPRDQTVPVQYVTPGLEEAFGATAAEATVPYGGPASAGIPVGAAFNPRGAIFGAAPEASMVTLQARRPAALVVRSPDNIQIQFARQLSAGESFRAPLGGGFVVDVSDPNAFDVYYGGEYHGSLPSLVTPLSQLNGEAQRMAAGVKAAETAPAQASAQVAAPPPAAQPQPQPQPTPSAAATGG